jgi:hypothetical protein
MVSERYIENNVIRNRDILGYADSTFVRRCHIGKGYGIADLLIFPNKGQHRVVIVEAKKSTSSDATGKVLGQLLLYYTGIRQVGLHGVRLMKNHAVKKNASSRSQNPISLKMLSGGISPPSEAWKVLQKGRKLKPDQIAMFVAIDGPPSDSLKAAVDLLSSEHNLKVGIISLMNLDELEIYHTELAN